MINFSLTRIGIFMVWLLGTALPTTALSADGNSYRLYDNFSDSIQRDVGIGGKYSINNTVSVDEEAYGNSFQILAEPIRVVSNESDDSVQNEVTAEHDKGGGRRTIPDVNIDNRYHGRIAGEGELDLPAKIIDEEADDDTDAPTPKIVDEKPHTDTPIPKAIDEKIDIDTAIPIHSIAHYKDPENTDVANLYRETVLYAMDNACSQATLPHCPVQHLHNINRYSCIESLHGSAEDSMHYAPFEQPIFADTDMDWMSLLWILVIIAIFVSLYIYSKRKNNPYLFGIVVFLVSIILLFISVDIASANTTVPLSHVYHGHLYDSSGNAITTEHTIRFSYWNTADYVTGDVTATGSINEGSSDYLDWTEVQTVTPNDEGFFQVSLGSITPLPSFKTMKTSALLDMFLQVEVKKVTDSDAQYDLLDYDTTDDAIDRRAILSNPFSLNSDLLDQHDTGTSSGSIPVLLSGGLLPTSTIPGETNADTLVLDADNSISAGPITLQFGSTLAKTLSYDTTENYFSFNDDVSITGDLTVSGLINGIDLNSIATTTDSHLRVSSGAGLTFNVSGGSYRINGSTTEYAGNSGNALADNATNYAFFTSSGLIINTSGFTDSGSTIRLAEIVTSSGSISTVTDRRVLQSDDREHNIVNTLHAEYEHATYQGDATNNVGQLSVGHDGITQKNYYVWTSTSTSLQDYDIVLPIALPDDFTSWNSSNPLSITYRSTSSNNTDNKLDISALDTNGSPVTLSGSSTDLTSTSWATTTIDFSGTPTWTPGKNILVKLKLSAKGNYQMHVADTTIRFNTFEK